MNFESPSKEESGESQKVEGSSFEIKKKIGDWALHLDIKAGSGPAQGSIDFEKKAFDLNITPEEIKQGFTFLSERIEKASPGFWERQNKKIIEANKRLDEELQRRRRDRESREDTETVRRYAEQTGQTEAEIVNEFLEEISEEEKREE